MEIYVVNEFAIEEDFRLNTGYFTEVELAKSLQPSLGIDFVSIQEMSLLDGQFLPPGKAITRELEDGIWSDWIEIHIKEFND